MNALNIDETLYQKAREKALAQKTPFKAVLEKLLRQWLKEAK